MSKKNKEQRNKQKIEDEVLFLDEGYWLDEDDEKFGDVDEEREEISEDEEEYELEDEIEDEEFIPKKKNRKKIAIIVGSIIGLIAAIYIGISIFFISHFTINKIKASCYCFNNIIFCKLICNKTCQQTCNNCHNYSFDKLTKKTFLRIVHNSSSFIFAHTL